MTAVVRLVLLAHASTEAQRAVRFPADEPLSQRGRRELERAVAPVADRVVAAPERRAVETAAALGTTAVVDRALRDLDYGNWAGRAMDEVPAESLQQWLTDPHAAPHGGESIAELTERVARWLDGLAPGRIVAVAHPAVIRAATVYALGAPPAGFWRIDVRPLAQVRLHGRGGRWSLRLG